MKNIKFSIVVPTRNRAKTLKYCLLTCINQNYDNYEIIVSDNCSDDNTRQVVEQLECDKIKYFRTNEVLPMTKNYQFALKKVKGEYVIYLGDDDGLHLHALNLLNKVINLLHVPVIRWNLDYYAWPTYLLPNFQNYLELRDVNKSEFVYGVEKIRKVLNFEERYITLPMLYMNSAIKVDFIKGILDKNLELFDSSEPDVYSGLITAYYSKYYFNLGFPVSLAGSSGKSVGMGNTSLIDGNDVANEYRKLNESYGLRFTSIFDKIRFSETLTVEDAINYAMDNFLGESKEFKINYHNMILNMIKDVRRSCSYNVENGKEVFYKLLNYIHDVIKTKFNDDTKTFFENEVLKNIKEFDYYNFNEEFVPHFNNDCLVFNAEKFNVNDIYGASKLSENALNYYGKIDQYIKKLNKAINCATEISNYKNIGIYGTSSHGKALLQLIKYTTADEGCNIFFFDSNENNWGKEIEGYSINSPQSIKKVNIDKIVICSYSYQEEIYRTLLKYIGDNKIMKLYQKDEEFYFDIFY